MNQTRIVVDNITYCWDFNLKKYFWCDDLIDYFDEDIDLSYQVAPGNTKLFYSLLNINQNLIAK